MADLPEGPVKAPEPLSDKVHTWPYLVRVEFIAGCVMILFLLVWSIVLDAPLLDPADPSRTPVPSKAPWYFVGLQAMLVYFDPWIAGVVLPALIIVGLILLPYLDSNPAGVGVYTLRRRRSAGSVFLVGFFLWVGFILVGQFFRGPGWIWYWPWESWEVHKPVYEKTWDFPWPVGLAAIVGYVALGLHLPRRLRPAVFRTISWGRYATLMLLVLGMIALPIKMVLRLAFDVHYVLVTPWFRI